MKDTEKATGQHVEMVHDEISESPKLDGEAIKAMGTVKLTEGSIIYIPTPTADPQGMISHCNFSRKVRKILMKSKRSSQHASLAEDSRADRYIYL